MKTWIPIALLVALAACSQAPQPSSGEATTAEPTTARTSAGAATDPTLAQLHQYHWRLVEATDADGARIVALFARAEQPLQLDFGKHGMSVGNTCNRMHGAVTLSPGHIHIGALAATLMACADAGLMALDEAVQRQLQGELGFDLDTTGGAARLVLTSELGATLVFSGEPTAASRYGSAGQTVFLEVAAQTVACPGDAAAAGPCLKVRQVHFKSDGTGAGQPGPWHPMTAAIEGYAHQPGVRNVLRLKRFDLDAPAASAPRHAWVLDMVVESETVAPASATGPQQADGSAGRPPEPR